MSVVAGVLVGFDGVVAPNPPNYAADVGVDQTEGAAELDRLGFHVATPAAAATVRGGP